MIANALGAARSLEEAEVKWSEAGRLGWNEIYAELSEAKPGLLGALSARGEAQVNRLALTYALFARHASANTVATALQELAALNLVTVTRRGANGAGRPTETWTYQA